MSVSGGSHAFFRPTVAEIEDVFDRLWPLHRSLTGAGNRKTLGILSEIVPMKTIEVPSGTACFDWIVPPEWSVRRAWIKDLRGRIVADVAWHNLHLVSYSVPFSGRLPLRELRRHLHSRPDLPDAIPYVTSYYERAWGFCLPHRTLESLEEGDYEVLVDSTLDTQGSMTVGELTIPGSTEQEILFSANICHPSLANNELSGPIVAAFVGKDLSRRRDLRYTYRFVFLPETIGSIWYLSQFGNRLREKLAAGFVLTCLGGRDALTYKRSRRGQALPDRVAEVVVVENGGAVEDFFPSGSDERQYCSPGFDLPVGSLIRTAYARYPEYHTSADDKRFICFGAIQESIVACLQLIRCLESNATYLNQYPFGEPHLARRGLAPSPAPMKEGARPSLQAIQWLLNLSDGSNDLVEIARRSRLQYAELRDAAEELAAHSLLSRIA